jgi:hypothetical protein
MFTFRSSIAMALITVAAVHLASHRVMADEESGAVKGKVTLNGEALEKGRIFFHIGNDQFVGAKIKNGEFSVDKVPVGDWKVTVEGDGIPAVYTVDVQTPLKVAVTKDSQTFEFSLKRR